MEEGPPVIAAYLAQGRRRGGAGTEADQVRAYVGLAPGASLGEIAEVANRYPVLRVRYLG